MHLHSQRQGKLRWDDALVAFVPDGAVAGPAGRRRRRAAPFDPRRAASPTAPGPAPTASSGAGLPGRAAAPSAVRAAAAGRRGPPLWLVPGRDGEPGDWTRTSSTCSGTRPSPTCCGPPAPACAASSTSSATPPSAPANDQGKTSGVNAIGVIAAALGRPRRRRDRHHHLPGAVRAGRVRRAGRPRPRRPVRPRADHVDPPLARRARRRVRDRRAVAAAVVLPAGRRVHGRRRARECRAARDGRRR